MSRSRVVGKRRFRNDDQVDLDARHVPHEQRPPTPMTAPVLRFGMA
jgi:hypothetical protein